MASYRFLVQQLSGFFEGCEFHDIPRERNEAADSLAKVGSTRVAIPASVSLEHLRKPSIRPSPDSDSIYSPEETEPLAGGARKDPGASGKDPGLPNRLLQLAPSERLAPARHHQVPNARREAARHTRGLARHTRGLALHPHHLLDQPAPTYLLSRSAKRSWPWCKAFSPPRKRHPGPSRSSTT